MDLLIVMINNFSKLQFAKAEKGFTLVELLVAMFILTLIVFAFTPLLVGSIESIHFAGDKSEALYEGQSDVEVDIAERNTADETELVFIYEDTSITVPGGLVDVEKTKGEATAWLSGFVPYIPSIDLYLSPLPLVEGYDDIEIIIMGKGTIPGKDTDFNEVDNVTIYDTYGFKVQEPAINVIEEETDIPAGYAAEDIPEGYDQYAWFTLKEGLTNSRGPYMVAVKWLFEDGIEINVEARLQVVLPYAAAVGSGQTLMISPDYKEIWKDKIHQAMGLGELNDIIWTGFEFVAVTNNRIVVWKDRQEPFRAAQADKLKSVAYGAGRLVAVGDSGLVATSTDRTQWLFTYIDDKNIDLKAVSWNGNEFVAVGSNGAILSSPDGADWTVEAVNWADEDGDGSSVTFKGAAYGNSTGVSHWLAVGKGSEGGVIYKSTGGNWEKVNNIPEGVITHGLNDIIYDDSKFIVVGENGTVRSSTSENGWDEITVGTSSILNANAIAWAKFTEDTTHYVIVGDGGRIITGTKSDDEDNWVVQTSGTTANLNGVALRWIP